MSDPLVYSDRYRFVRCEIGLDDPTAYLASLPAIDLVYCAPPSRQLLSWWHGYRQRPYSHAAFLAALFDVLDRLDAAEVYIEATDSARPIGAYLAARYPRVAERAVRYAAPRDAGRGLARKRSPGPLLAAARDVAALDRLDQLPAAVTSDALVEALLCDRPRALTVCDPCIGKGLLLRAAYRYGHACYGLESNADRLRSLMTWLTTQEVSV